MFKLAMGVGLATLMLAPPLVHGQEQVAANGQSGAGDQSGAVIEQIQFVEMSGEPGTHVSRGQYMGPQNIFSFLGGQPLGGPPQYHSAGYVPRHMRGRYGSAVAPVSEEVVISNPEVVQHGPIQHGMVKGGYIKGGPIASPGCGKGGCASGACGVESCGPVCGSDCGGCNDCCPYFMIPLPIFSGENLTLFSGVHGVKGPRNQGQDASFGFHGGFNWGAPLAFIPWTGFGMQFGFQGVFSDFSGAGFGDANRDQYFTTFGFFRRVDHGLQGGLVADYVHDEWNINVDAWQLRGEISWVFNYTHDIGFWFTANTRDDEAVFSTQTGTQRVDTSDIYAFFYRRRFGDCGGSEWRGMVGWTNNNDGYVAFDMSVPLSCRFALVPSFAYLIPEEGAANGGATQEAWNVQFNLVWYPRCNAYDAKHNRYQPLFPVADNGSMIIDVP